jgi:protein TonB
MSVNATASDPIELVVGSWRADDRWLPVAALAAATVHVGIALALPRIHRSAARPADVLTTRGVLVDVAPPPAPREPTPPPPSTGPRSEMRPASRVPANATVPPAQAAAGNVLTRSDPGDPADFTGDGFVVGSAATYAGGPTTSSPPLTTHSVASAPARSQPRAEHETQAEDRSRAASASGSSSWRCPFPPEADSNGIDSAVVTIRVTVAADGSVRAVAILSDPGHGFGSAAQRCAFARQWNSARDHDGAPAEGTVTIRVRFER